MSMSQTAAQGGEGAEGRDSLSERAVSREDLQTALSGFTPGPWSLDDPLHAHVIDTDYHTVDAGEGFYPKGFGLAGHMSEANARLIAAAPELLAHLQFAVKLLGGIPFVGGTAQVDAMRAAIAKATGDAALASTPKETA